MKALTALILVSMIVSVSVIVPSTCASGEPSVGVKEGDWMEYSVNITGTPPPVHVGVVGMRIEVLQVEGAAFPVNLTLRFANGTQSSKIWQFNLTAGNTEGWIIIPSNLSPSDTFFDNFSKTDKHITIQSQEQKTELGATRTVTFANDSFRQKQWDKATGVFVGSTEILKNWTAVVHMTATNMWSPQILGLDQKVFYTIITAVAAVLLTSALVVVVALRKKNLRKG